MIVGRDVVAGIKEAMAWMAGIAAVIGAVALLTAVAGDVITVVVTYGLIGLVLIALFTVGQTVLTCGIANYEHGRTVGFCLAYALVGFPVAFLMFEDLAVVEWAGWIGSYLAAIPLTVWWQETRYRADHRSSSYL